MIKSVGHFDPREQVSEWHTLMISCLFVSTRHARAGPTMGPLSRLLVRRPLLANTVSSGVLLGVGDAIQQGIEFRRGVHKESSYNWRRTGAFSARKGSDMFVEEVCLGVGVGSPLFIISHAKYFYATVMFSCISKG